jgi:hypothetical protein
LLGLTFSTSQTLFLYHFIAQQFLLFFPFFSRFEFDFDQISGFLFSLTPNEVDFFNDVANPDSLQLAVEKIRAAVRSQCLAFLDFFQKSPFSAPKQTVFIPLLLKEIQGLILNPSFRE